MRQITKQRGAALIFSLIMLLLLSLLGVNAMQQNRLQFLMSGNAQMQTNVLAAAENLLVMAEEFTDVQRIVVGGAVGECIKNDAGQFTPFAPTDITGTLTLTQDAQDASTISILGCTCLATNAACETAFTPCLSEVYDIRVTFTGGDGSTQRTVESKYAVQCTQ